MTRFRLPASDRPVWYHVLLASLVLSAVSRPVARALAWGDTLLALVGAVVLLACVAAMGRARASRLLAWAALVPAVLLTLLVDDRQSAPRVVGQGLGALVMLLVCWRILQRIFRESHVSWATISGAIAVYLLLSSVWNQLYMMAAWMPGLEPAFSGVPPASELLAALDPGAVRTELESLFSYFSLVTLTTLGYGDVSPTHPVTRMLCTTEAVVGQLYLVVLVARLVSIHATEATRRGGEPT